MDDVVYIPFDSWSFSTVEMDFSNIGQNEPVLKQVPCRALALAVFDVQVPIPVNCRHY
jgi:hypothetical protein